jgi:hypothetical protein
MVFKSKIKEELLQELKNFIFWYRSQLANDLVGPVYIDEPLTRQTVASVTVYNDFSVSVGLTDPKENPLFEFEIDFVTTLNSEYVILKYSNEDSLGHSVNLPLTDIESIDCFLVQAIKSMSSESYVKHFLTVFKNHIRKWLVF